jgi:hypothetical protein
MKLPVTVNLATLLPRHQDQLSLASVFTGPRAQRVL